jgi:hypothetical protein
MRLILATNHLGLGGSESYLLTVAGHFERLGHDVTLFAPEPGAGADLARSLGLAVVDAAGLPSACDAALAQDAGVSLELAGRYPDARQVFVAHSEIFDLQLPPQLSGAVSHVVVLNDVVERRVRALAVRPEIVRLRQPIDQGRFTPQGPLPQIPRRALLLTNNPVADRMGMIEAACAGNGLELVKVGGAAGQTEDPRPALFAADIVIGYGRSILEAMSCGRAAYVYDRSGGDGWVDPESYPAIEAGGFSARSGRGVVDAEQLREDLGRYDPTMGPVNHDLVIVNHRANVHAERLIELLEEARPPSIRGPLEEMARLVRLEWRARVDTQALGVYNARLQGEVQRFAELAEERREEAPRAAVQAAAETAARYEATASWRLTRPLRRLGALLKRFRARR